MKTEAISDAYKDLDSWSFEKTLDTIIDSNRRAVEAVAKTLPQLTQAAEGIASRLESGGRLVYVGAGTSGRLAVQDAAELPPTFGFERHLVLMAGGNKAEGSAVEGAEDDADEAREAVAEDIDERDAVVGLAASGRTPYTVAGIQEARKRGAFTVGVANNAGASLLSVAEIGIFLDTGPEVLAGSTRLAAGTSQKIVLNALSTSVLVRLGGAYQNLMVGMQPKNIKLRERAAAIVSSGAGVSTEDARAALEASNWQMREAIVMLKAGVSFAEARERLEASGNRVRDALKSDGR